jgi:hypothetical protein
MTSLLYGQQKLGCPTSRSFFARCGIPRYSTRNSIGVIRSEAEGSAVLRTFRGNAKFYPQTELSSRPERSVVERSAVSFFSAHTYSLATYMSRRAYLCG